MLLISTITYSRGLYSSLIDTTQKIELKYKKKKNLIGLEIIGTPLKLSYSRLIYENNRNSFFFGTAIHPLLPYNLLLLGIPNFSFYSTYRIAVSKKSMISSELGIEILPYYFPVIFSNEKGILQVQTISSFINIGYVINKKYFDLNIISLKFSQKLDSQYYISTETENTYKFPRYAIMPTSSIILKF